jgi:hypothetical protein
MGGMNSTHGEICSILVLERTRQRKAVSGGRKILELIQMMVNFALRSSSQPP